MKNFVYVVANVKDGNSLIDFFVKTKSNYITELNYRESYIILLNERWYFRVMNESDFADVGNVDGYRFSQKAKISLSKTGNYHTIRKKLSDLYKESSK
ncbi:hypothetical protein MJV52_002278 [Listeria monocytogenes]|uniref:Uncharacterized protein n=1 Tax=Listeria monocytogenes TaxID=1639 RepID=A0A3H3KWZ2_LISMN|nr:MULTISPECIES: hypothetical protein [Listeria]YP_001468780.1 gp76 [Listeria phage B054]EAF5676603.1 hypothetical protein [Listeria innocua]MDA56089.1 hypothetical protein [Listeria monocytogenes serotype 4b]AAY53181.1 gp76 [Listeria phage B054]AGR15562.1 hypothetical protein M643_02985 [Listeria monocytogenes]ASD76060.1 hypothetical protein ARX15_08890 [Listeria monocytogenes]